MHGLRYVDHGTRRVGGARHGAAKRVGGRSATRQPPPKKKKKNKVKIKPKPRIPSGDRPPQVLFWNSPVAESNAKTRSEP